MIFKEIVPLPEDVELKDLQSLKSIQEKMCWKWQKIISFNLEQEVSFEIVDSLGFLAVFDNDVIKEELNTSKLRNFFEFKVIT